MKIEYDVPCPCPDGLVKETKYQEYYDKIFYFAHSKKKRLVIEMDKPNNFAKSIYRAYRNIYPPIQVHIEGRKLMVYKTW